MADIPLLYRDEFLVVCEKPVGIPSESPGLPDLLRVQEGKNVYPVHRLDQTTGGVIVFACSSGACSAMQKLFQQNLVLKEYLAVVSGAPETDSGLFCDLLFHDQRSNRTFIVKKKRKGVKEAVCEWNVLQTAHTPEGVMSLIRVRLHTGRTHQIRVQFASRKMPLIGDRRYGCGTRAYAPALWSARICFPHPYSGIKSVDVCSFPPDIFPWSCFSLLRDAPESFPSD